MAEFEAFLVQDDLEIHPAALILPKMSEDEFEEFKEDILGNGLIEPLVLFQGKVLDGRNRYLACKELGIEVWARNWEGGMDPVDYVVSKNIHRRQLTPTQRANAAAKALDYYADRAKERQREAGGDRKSEEYKESVCQQADKPIDPIRATKEAGEKFDVSHDSVNKAKFIQKHGTEEERKQLEEGHTPLKPLEQQVRERVKSSSESKHKPQFNQTNENIDWAKWSWNPVTGCLHGCPYCYARDIANRFYDHGFEPHFYPDRLSAPENTKVPNKEGIGWRNVFVCSMGDLFGVWVEQDWIDQVMEAVRNNQQWNFLFLTKNPARLVDVWWPENAWVGTTVDCQARVDAAERAFSEMAKKGNKPAVSFISFEPLSEPITINLEDVDWIIIGGQSKSSQAAAEQPLWDWVEDLHNQARYYDCKVYWKPNLKVRPQEYPTEL